MDDCDYVTHISALIFHQTGVDPDSLSDEDFAKAAMRVDYSMRKLELMKR